MSERVSLTASINRTANAMVLGKIQEICMENGINYNYEINEKFVLKVIGKATPKKVRGPIRREQYADCPVCGIEVSKPWGYCYKCGQKLDWEHKESED